MLSPYTFNRFSLLWDKVSYLTKTPKIPLVAIDSRPYHPVLILIHTPAAHVPWTLDFFEVLVVIIDFTDTGSP